MASGKQNQEAGCNRGKKNEVTFTQGKGADAKKITVKIPDGYKKINERSRYGMPIYSNGKSYISPDKFGHNAGVWKKANSVDALKSRATRTGTYDKDLNRIGD